MDVALESREDFQSKAKLSLFYFCGQAKNQYIFQIAILLDWKIPLHTKLV